MIFGLQRELAMQIKNNSLTKKEKKKTSKFIELETVNWLLFVYAQFLLISLTYLFSNHSMM